jgi:hypothetical protein
MRWGKIVLLVQAIATLVIGTIFVLQMLDIEQQRSFSLTKLQNLDIPEDVDINQIPQIQRLTEASERTNTAGYILFVVSIIELMIIMQLMS